MAAWRYEISLFVLKKFFNLRREISYLRAAMCYPPFQNAVTPTNLKARENIYYINRQNMTICDRSRDNVLV